MWALAKQKGPVSVILREGGAPLSTLGKWRLIA